MLGKQLNIPLNMLKMVWIVLDNYCKTNALQFEIHHISWDI